MEKITLFTNILPEEQEAMRVCMQARELTFSAHEILMEYSCSMKKIGLILEGEALLYCCDADGTEYILDELSPDSVFGEPFLLSSNSQHYYVQAQTSVRVLFIDYQHVIKRCTNACSFHSQMVSNLFQLTAQKAQLQTSRIYLLSRSSIRKKLMTYLHERSAALHSSRITVPMSYTSLAQYLCVDRSAMMRELKSLEQQKLIKKSGRTIWLLP